MRIKRIEYKHNSGIMLDKPDSLILKYGKRERIIKSGKWYINRNTPVGDDSELWEVKPFDGRKYIHWMDVVAILRQEE